MNALTAAGLLLAVNVAWLAWKVRRLERVRPVLDVRGFHGGFMVTVHSDLTPEQARAIRVAVEAAVMEDRA